MSRGTKGKIVECIKEQYFQEELAPIPKEKIFEKVDRSKRIINEHLPELEDKRKIESKEIGQKKFYAPKDTDLDDLVSQKEKASIRKAIKDLRERLAGFREPSIDEVAAELGKNEESELFRKKFREVAKEEDWSKPKNSKQRELVELLKGAVAVRNDFRKGNDYPSLPEGRKKKDKAKLYIEKNESVVEEIKVRDDCHRNDMVHANLPYELKIITGKNKIEISVS